MGNMSISWKGAILISVTSFMIAFPGFLLYEVIWGDILKDILDPSAKEHPYSLINVILHIGLFAVFGISLLVNLFIYRDFTFKSKVVANLLALVLTIVILFLISFSFMFALFPSLKTTQVLGIWPLYFTYFSIYVLPNPIWFWIIAIMIYHIILILFNRMFLTRDIYYFKKSKSNRKEKVVYKSRVIR